MNFLSLLQNKDYISLVKQQISKIFVHEGRKYKHEPTEVSIIIHITKNGEMQIMSYSNTENKVLRIIPDKEIETIILK